MIQKMSPVLADVSYPNEGDEVTVQADNTHDAVDDDFFHSTVVNAPIPVDINSGDEDDRENDSPPQPNDVGDIHQQHRRPRCLVHRVTVDTSREIASRDMIVNNSIRQSNLCLSWKYVVLAAVVALSLGIPAIFLYLSSSHDNRQDTSSINGQSPTKDSPAYTEEGNTYLRELRTQILGIDTFRLEPDSAEIVATDWMAYADSPRVSLNDTVRLEQRYGLLVLYFEMGGIDWHFIGWADNPGIHECDWERVVCNDRGRVQELHLGDDVYLAGSLSEEIRFLSSLSEFFLPCYDVPLMHSKPAHTTCTFHQDHSLYQEIESKVPYQRDYIHLRIWFPWTSPATNSLEYLTLILESSPTLVCVCLAMIEPPADTRTIHSPQSCCRGALSGRELPVRHISRRAEVAQQTQ